MVMGGDVVKNMMAPSADAPTLKGKGARFQHFFVKKNVRDSQGSAEASGGNSLVFVGEITAPNFVVKKSRLN